MQKFCFIFPGQGSQKVGMLSELMDSFPTIQETLNEADDALGFKLSELILQGPVASLNKTENTQPALLASSIALWRIFEAASVSPISFAGHSLGEYSALVAAKTLDFADALRLVHLRGRLMQEAVPEGEGAMAAVIGLDDEAVEKACARINADASSDSVFAANFNAPGQVVVAGKTQSVQALSDVLKEMGAKRVLPLPVSVPSHTPLMQSAADKLKDALEGTHFSRPSAPIYPNAYEGESTQDEAKLRSLLVSQLVMPVRWTSFMQKIAKAHGAESMSFVECGPGAVLAGLLKRTIPSHRVYSPSSDVESVQTLAKAFEALAN